MLLNPRYVPLLLQNWSEVNRCAHRLNSSLARLQVDFPLTGERLTTDDESLFERLDAFRVRYADLQDAIGNKLFRSILLVLDEKSINMADTLSKMEKYTVLLSVDEWRMMREIRNSFSHDYPDAEQERALTHTAMRVSVRPWRGVVVSMACLPRVRRPMDAHHARR